MGRSKKVGKSARNARAAQDVSVQEQDYTKAPHSFVFQRGHVGKTVKELVSDIRKMMEPYTATHLKVRKKNVMKDFLTIAGTLHVSHFIVLTKTDVGTYLRLICVPKGPTLTFKVNSFCLTRDVLSAQRHPDVDSGIFTNYAVLVTNIPSDAMEDKLMNVTFKNMFPSINPNTVKLNNMRRTVLINYNKEDKSIDLRHYTMRVVPTGLSRGLKKLMKSKLPNLGDKSDISEVFLDKALSDSEGEQDGPHNQVTVPQKVKDRGVSTNSTNAIRLKEIGPRLNLQLVKIEEGFEGGNVLYHALITKTAEELAALKVIREKKQKERLIRKQRQEANVLRKQEAKEAQVKKTREGMKRKAEQDDTSSPSANKKAVTEENDDEDHDDDDDEDDDDDIEYFKQEVGEEPQPEMFSQTGKKRKFQQRGQGPKPKKFKKSVKKIDSKQVSKKGGGSKSESKFSIKFSNPAKGKGHKKGQSGPKTKVLHKKGQKSSFKAKRKSKR